MNQAIKTYEWEQSYTVHTFKYLKLEIEENTALFSRLRFSGFNRNILFFNDRMNQAIKLMNGNNFALCTHSNTKTSKIEGNIAFFQSLL